MSFRLYRQPQHGEFFVIFGDCAQGGADSNFIQYMSKRKVDIPLVMQKQGTIASVIPFLIQSLEWIYTLTGVPPMIALERNNGGASAMHNLVTSNLSNHWRIYYMKDQEGKTTDKPGWDTNTWSRPKMLGEYEVAFNNQSVTIYDKETIAQHKTFIVGKSGKAEAAPNTHDDAVMSAAGVWQMYQTENPPMKDELDKAMTGNITSLWRN